MKLLGLLVALSTLATAKIWLDERFYKNWDKKWVYSTHKDKDESAHFEHSPGKWYDKYHRDHGALTTTDKRFYQMSRVLNEEFNNEEKGLILQFTVKFTQDKIDCHGGYVKLLKSGFDQKTFDHKTPWHVTFGPDFCGRRTQHIDLALHLDMRKHTHKELHVAP